MCSSTWLSSPSFLFLAILSTRNVTDLFLTSWGYYHASILRIMHIFQRDLVICVRVTSYPNHSTWFLTNCRLSKFLDEFDGFFWNLVLFLFQMWSLVYIRDGPSEATCLSNILLMSCIDLMNSFFSFPDSSLCFPNLGQTALHLPVPHSTCKFIRCRK